MSAAFEATFNYLIEELRSELPYRSFLSDALKRLQDSLVYNVPYYTELRCGVVTSVYQDLVQRPLFETENQKLYVLGTLVQMIQTFLGLLDDLVDGGELRYGKPTWTNLHKNPSLLTNDILLMEHATFRLLFKHFGNEPEIFTKLVHYFFTTVYENCLATGQSLVSTKETEKRFSWKNFESLTLTNNRFTIPITIHIPMILAGYSENDELWKRVDKTVCDLVMFRTIRDDLVDSFDGENMNTRKSVDRDICTGKLTWLIVKAHKICTKEEWIILEKAYGTENLENITLVKQLFVKLQIPVLCKQYLGKLRLKIEKDICGLISDGYRIGFTLQKMLDKLGQLPE